MRPWFERFALRTAVFASGALLMALEVAAFRIIGKTFGSALRETTTVISVFLAAMAIGYWAGGRVADRRPRPTTLVATLFIAAASLLLVPWIDASLSPRISASSLAMATHAFLATTVLFALPTVLLAATSPIAIRLFSTTTGQSGSTAGSISALSTAGSIAGSIVTAFFLIDWLESISRTVLFVAAGVAATALLVLLAARSEPIGLSKRSVRIITAAATLFAIAAGGAFIALSMLDRGLAAPLPGTRIVHVADSAYHRLTVRDRGPFRILYFNFGEQTLMNRSDPNGPGLRYTDASHISPLLRPGIRRVLMIGLGGGTYPKQFLAHYPDISLDVVEVDPAVIEVAQEHFGLRPDPRMRIHAGDGRTFFRRNDEKWDLIILDVATTTRYGHTLPAHLMTREYFTLLSSRLTERGILHVHCPFWQSPVFPAVQQTLLTVFPSLLRTEGEFFASQLPLVFDRDDLAARAKASPVGHFTALQELIAQLTTDRLPAAGSPVLTDDYAPVDTLIYGSR
jgi:predicted membrane-bound spermidine synthase